MWWKLAERRMPRTNHTKPNQTTKYTMENEAKMFAIWQPRQINSQTWLLYWAVCEKKCWKREMQGNHGLNHEGFHGKSPLVSYTMCWWTETFSRKELVSFRFLFTQLLVIQFWPSVVVAGEDCFPFWLTDLLSFNLAFTSVHFQGSERGSLSNFPWIISVNH